MKTFTITAASWKEYRDKLAKISDTAADMMQKYVLENGFEINQEMIDYAYALSTKYGEAAGALTADYYDSMREYWNAIEHGNTPWKAAEVADTATRIEVMRAISAATEATAPGAVHKLVKQVSADTVAKNAIRDGAEWAWIPGPGETCAFCLTLASRGWQRASKKMLKNGHVEHIHGNCRCTFGVRFSSQMDVEGYAPDRYLEKYENADGSSWKAKVNSMRREQYAQNKDVINAQKREAYARRVEINQGDK